MRMLPRLGLLALLFVADVAFPQSQQSSTSSSQSGATDSQGVIRTNTRLVVLDVVAVDDKGNPVADLKREEITILEDGKPQAMDAFGLQRPSTSLRQRPPAAPGVFDNTPQYTSSSLNIILLDTLNTEFSSHAYAQDQLIKYLESGPTIQPTAVYALEGNLTLLHEFTTDTKVLRDVLANFKPQGPSHVENLTSMSSPFARQGSFAITRQGIITTLLSLDFLAQSLAAYPGRKNLIWLSEGFPLSLYPPDNIDSGTAGPGAVAEFDDFGGAVERIADALMNAQVAVYPIDAAGVSKNDRFPARVTMRDVAERTGGKAFYNRNDLDLGVRTSIDDGSTYYTMAYYPENRKWDGKLRNIDLKIDRPGVTLRYRRGYYAIIPGGTDSVLSAAGEFGRALALASPSYNGVLFKAQVVPPADKAQKVTVNFAIDPHTIRFQSQADGLQHANVKCVVAAFADKLHPPQLSEQSTINAAIKPEVYQQLMHANLPCHQSISLKPGSYELRLGVIDSNSRLMGTVGASVTVPK